MRSVISFVTRDEKKSKSAPADLESGVAQLKSEQADWVARINVTGGTVERLWMKIVGPSA